MKLFCAAVIAAQVDREALASSSPVLQTDATLSQLPIQTCFVRSARAQKSPMLATSGHG